MSIRVDARFVHDVVKNWGDPKTNAYLDSMRVEMRRDLKKCNRNMAPILESLIEELSNEEFWVKMDWMFDFRFTP